MTPFLLYCIATIGLTLIITQGNIFRPIRQFFGDWAEKIQKRREQKYHERETAFPAIVSRRSCIEWFNELINCAQCTGFWAGLFCGLLLVNITSQSLENLCIRHIFDSSMIKSLIMWFCCGLGGSFLASLGSNVIDWVFYRKMNALRQLEEQDILAAERRASMESRE